MDDTENTESQTTETTESQTNDTSSNSEPSFSSDALNNNDTGPGFDIDWSNWENDTKTNDNDTSDSSDSSDNYKAAEAWVEMHQHTDWGSGLTVDDVFNNDNKDSGNDSADNNDSSYSTGETTNQSRTEKQGDYDTSSKENSNVQTSTIGKQDEITTTPDTITENKGIVSNSNIQSVEGLDFQQKDKDDLESRKDREKAEEEDKSDQLRNELKAEGEKNANANKDGKGFQVGNKDKKEAELEDNVNAAKQNRENLEKEREELENRQRQLEQERAELGKKADKVEKEVEEEIEKTDDPKTKGALETIRDVLSNIKAGPITIDLTKPFEVASRIVKDMASSWGNDINRVNDLFKVSKEQEENSKRLDELSKEYEEAVKNEEYANKALENYRKENNTDVIPETPATPEEKPAPEEPETPATPEITEETKITPEELPPEEKPAVPEVPEEKPEEKGQELVDPTDPIQKANNLTNQANSIRNDIKNGKYNSEEERQAANDVADSYDNLAKSITDAAEASKAIVDENGKVDLNKCTSKQIDDWEKSKAQLAKNYNDALSKGKAYEQHYGNKQFVRDIAKANDFKVPGTNKTYDELATEMATKSPQIAQAMYEAKANRYKKEAEKAAEDGHKVSAWWNNTLSKIETLKANMSQTFIGSKLTLADNKVRDQFNKMADLNMKATYAAYNNRLKHPEDYQPEDLEEARQQIDQAHALQYASAALKASTGGFSGLGDSIKDGVYGTTNAKDLSGYQQVLADIGAFSQIVLGMGFTQLANKGYNTFNNLYPGSLFSKDIDKDGFAWTEEYGNNPAAEAILAVAQLSYGVSLLMNPFTFTNGVAMLKNAIQNALNAAYGVRNDARKLVNITNDITSYFEDVKEKEGIPPEAIPEIDNAIDEIKTKTTTTEDFKINSDEVGNLDNWLEGSGSNTADNGKFNQKLSYEDWLKLIQADPTMREYAKKLAEEKNKNAQENNADSRVNS